MKNEWKYHKKLQNYYQMTYFPYILNNNSCFKSLWVIALWKMHILYSTFISVIFSQMTKLIAIIVANGSPHFSNSTCTKIQYMYSNLWWSKLRTISFRKQRTKISREYNYPSHWSHSKSFACSILFRLDFSKLLSKGYHDHQSFRHLIFRGVILKAITRKFTMIQKFKSIE